MERKLRFFDIIIPVVILTLTVVHISSIIFNVITAYFTVKPKQIMKNDHIKQTSDIPIVPDISDILEINEIDDFVPHLNSSKREVQLNIPSSALIAQEVLRVLKPDGKFRLTGAAVLIKPLDSDFKVVDEFSKILSSLPTVEQCINSLLFEGFINATVTTVDLATQDGIDNVFNTIGKTNAHNKEEVMRALLSKLAFVEICAYKPTYETGVSISLKKKSSTK